MRNETLRDSRFPSELIAATILQFALIVLWLATRPHTFDAVTMFVRISSRVIAIACIARGIWLYRPDNLFIWWVLVARLAWSFFFAPIHNFWVKDWLWWQVDSAAGTLCYIAIACYLVQRRAAARDGALWIDVTVICVGLLFTLFSYLGIPVVESGGRSLEAHFVGIVFPCIDTVLLGLVLLISFAGVKERNGSLALLLLAFAVVAVADLSTLMAALGMFSMTKTQPFAPFSLSFAGLVGAAALLPSMRRIERRNEGVAAKPGSVPRLTLMVAVFLLTLYRFVTWTARGPQPSPLLVGAVLTIMFLLIVVRSLLAIRALEIARTRVLRMLTHDGPTGLLNTAGLAEEYGRTLEAAGTQAEHSLILVRLRELREIGQLWGHVVRDELVTAYAATMGMTAAGGGVLARVGADQFALLIRTAGDDAAPAEWTAERIAESLRGVRSSQAAGITPTFDIGIAGGRGRMPLDELLREAESAASAARLRGQGRIARYDAEIAAREERRFALVNLLRGAVERNEFTLLYQPVVDLTTYRVAHNEALLRWTSAELGAISPNEFVPLAESSGAIEEITDWVLDTACRALGSSGDVSEEGYVMSINIGARSLQQPGLAQRIGRVLARHGVPATAICLELTERSLMEDPHGELAALRAAGIALAIDDFGTGYSNLAMLTRLNVDSLKLDVSLVHAAATEPALRQVVHSVLTPLNEIGVQIVAEGIETEAQCNLARALGCRYGQGWLFGKPQTEPARSGSIQPLQ